MKIDNLLQKHINTELCFHLNAFVEHPPGTKYVKNCRQSASNETFFMYSDDELGQCETLTDQNEQANFDIRCG